MAKTREDLLSKVRAYQDTANRHDLDAVMGMFARDAEFEIEGQFALAGEERIRSVHDYDVGIDTELEFVSCSAEGNTVTCQGVERNNWQRAAGIQPFFYTRVVFTFDAGLIKKIRATFSPRSGEAIGETLRAFDTWARENAPAEYAKLFTSEGKFIYGRQSGELVVDLLKQWRSTR